MKRKYQQVDNREIELDELHELDEVDFNQINEHITKWFNDKNIKIIDN
tara:strand:- start:1622 stop:1765 length:144 start_codon:yes stop_codon:yes gene_type:complete